MTTIIGIFFMAMGIFFVVLAQVLPGLAPGDETALVSLIFTIVGGVMAVLGLVILVVGRAAGKKREAKAKLIYETGVAAEATVTFVDRNYRVLVNNNPIYSIVEYKFNDTSGVEHVFRKDTVQSELVIRNQVEVGSTVNIKYLAEDPSQNILMLETL